MSELNFNSIFDGVTLALHNAFPSCQVHGGSVKQGLEPGDFNVLMPGANHEKEVGTRYRRVPTIDVIYYPKADPYNAECNDVAQKLTLLLESVTTPQGDCIHASSCSWEIAEGVLHVLLEYNHFVYIPQEQELMETLEISQEG